MSTLSLFDLPTYFDGSTYSPEYDRERLSGQLERVRAYMLAHDWVTLAELHTRVGGSEASVSARLRDLRKPRFGAYTVQRKRLEGGLFAYKVTGP